ncbi:MAG: sigma-54 dependent transcriptional regulator [Desulfatiglandaceae bacterium]|jgi:two-component system response regulator AtoC
METKKNILIIDSNPDVLSQLDEQISQLGFAFRCSAASSASMEQLEAMVPDIAVIGPSLDNDTSRSSLQKLKIINPGMPILVCAKEDLFREEARHSPFGGIHCFDPDLGPEGLSGALKDAMKHREETERLPEFPVLVGRSREISLIREKIRTVADKDITVLITGESGTGKELIARSVHYYSKRNKGPLIKINCGALPDELLESEVFGFQKGAFTGAHKNKPGRLELADGGTLFIDEIGDLSLSLQVKFLQVLEDKAFSRLGGVRDMAVDTRVVAATNKELSRIVREGGFRKDLFFRLNVVHIEAPPLRERREDILVMVEYFMNKYCYEFRREPLKLTNEISKVLTTYYWPGNVRELENAIRRAIVLRDWDFVMNEMAQNHGSTLPKNGALSRKMETVPPWGDKKVDTFFRKRDASLKKISKAYVGEVERQAISHALRESNWNRKKAAESLGVSYKTLLNRIEDLTIRP